MNCVRCPACPSEFDDEAYWVSLPPEGKKEAIRVNCPTCRNSFCSACMGSPYHFGCKCDEVMPYTRAWTEWVTGGRDAYMRELSKHVEKYRECLEEFEKKKEEYDKKVKEVEDRFKEIRENEMEMARTCRACPNCGCRIFKVQFPPLLTLRRFFIVCYFNV
jgi:type II secretory ATPase GspE/PulE/Tfp pilus assembly ATPase PilB-like protein